VTIMQFLYNRGVVILALCVSPISHILSDELQLKVSPTISSEVFHLKQPIWLKIEVTGSSPNPSSVWVSQDPNHGISITNSSENTTAIHLLAQKQYMDIPWLCYKLKSANEYSFELLLNDCVEFLSPGSFNLKVKMPVKTNGNKLIYLNDDLQIQLGMPLNTLEEKVYIKDLGQTLGSGTPEQKIRALRSLAVIKPENLPLFIKEGIEDKEEGVQLAALNAMSSFDPLQAKLLYAEALTSNFESVRDTAKYRLHQPSGT
jgi:hypothetical protein